MTHAALLPCRGHCVHADGLYTTLPSVPLFPSSPVRHKRPRPELSPGPGLGGEARWGRGERVDLPKACANAVPDGRRGRRGLALRVFGEASTGKRARGGDGGWVGEGTYCGVALATGRGGGRFAGGGSILEERGRTGVPVPPIGNRLSLGGSYYVAQSQDNCR